MGGWTMRFFCCLRSSEPRHSVEQKDEDPTQGKQEQGEQELVLINDPVVHQVPGFLRQKSIVGKGKPEVEMNGHGQSPDTQQGDELEWQEVPASSSETKEKGDPLSTHKYEIKVRYNTCIVSGRSKREAMTYCFEYIAGCRKDNAVDEEQEAELMQYVSQVAVDALDPQTNETTLSPRQ